MIIQARAARPSIVMDGKDWYGALAPYLISLEYEDNCDGKKADDLNIELADRDRRFISDWMPQKGAFFDAGIIAERWFAPNAAALQLDCGRFWIDTVEFELPDHKVKVKASSIPTNVRIKAGKETRGWEGTSLKDIANQIAKENNMQLDWQAQSNPRYSRTEQHEESGLAFLQKRANNAKLAIKVHRNKVIVFDEQQLEEAEPKFALLYGNVPAQLGMACYRMAGGTFTTKIVDTAKKAKVSHTSVATGETVTGEATAPTEGTSGSSPSRGALLNPPATTTPADQYPINTPDPDNVMPKELNQVVTEDVEHEEEEEREDDNPDLRAESGSDYYNIGGGGGSETKAKSIIRDKNKKKDTSKIELSLGNPLIAAGMTFLLKGVGQFDGKWFVESAHHEVGPEYKTELTIRKCLKGY